MKSAGNLSSVALLPMTLCRGNSYEPTPRAPSHGNEPEATSQTQTGADDLSSARRPNLGYIGIVDMTSVAEQILEQIRALTPTERLQVVERVIHEMADEVTPQPAATTSSIWSDESDADFEAFESSVRQLRTNDRWRASDAQDDS